jgi:hypothetical protein
LLPSKARPLLPPRQRPRQSPVARVAPRAPSGDPVIACNRFLHGLQTTPGAQPAAVHPTSDLAIMHAAIDDAIVSIDRSGGGEAAHDRQDLAFEHHRQRRARARH